MAKLYSPLENGTELYDEDVDSEASFSSDVSAGELNDKISLLKQKAEEEKLIMPFLKAVSKDSKEDNPESQPSKDVSKLVDILLSDNQMVEAFGSSPMYSAVGYTILFGFTCKAKSNTVLTELSTLFAMCLSLSLQSLLLYWTFFFIIEPEVANLQGSYRRFHAECFFQNATYSPELCKEGLDESDRRYLCESVLRHPSFLVGVILLWTVSVFVRLKWQLRLFQNIMATPTLPSSFDDKDGIVKDHSSDSTVQKIYAVKNSKRVMLLVTLIPRFAVSSSLRQGALPSPHLKGALEPPW